MSGLPRIAHVPMALSVQSSTLITVASQLGRAYAAMGGSSSAVLSDNRDARIPEMDDYFVDYTRNCPREWFTKRELAIDVVAGAAGRLRPYYGRLYDPAVEALEEHPADIVLLYEGHYASASLPRWQKLRGTSEICLYVHNPLSRSYGRRELTRLIEMSDRVIFCAEHLRASTEERLGKPDPRMVVVANGVEDIFFASRPRSAPEAFEIVFAGRIAEHKGVHVLLEAVAELESRAGAPAVTVKIVGGSNYGGSEPGPYEREVRERAAALRSPVEFAGWASREQIAQIFSTASVVCIPSLWDEGFPLVALEALASGSPVACSDSAGLREAVGEVGLIHRMGNAAELADGFATLASDPAEWERLSAAGVARAREFSWGSAAARIAGV